MAGKRTRKPRAPAALARDLERFAASGYREERFTEALYRALRQHFGFIAHTDRAGFHAARFANLPDRVETLRQILESTPWPERPDELALRAVVVERKFLAAAEQELSAEIEAAERAELARLLAKYPEAS